MNRSLERRVIKLEEATQELRPGVYIVWSLDEDGIPEAIRSAITSRYVQPTDPIIIGLWSSEQPVPAPRWVSGLRDFGDEELQILKDIVANAEVQDGLDDRVCYRMPQHTDEELLAILADSYRPAVHAAIRLQ